MVYEQYRAAIKRAKRPFNKYRFLEKKAGALQLSKKAKQRLGWIIYYYEKTNKNAKLTCRHFNIHRSQWYYWFNRFDDANLQTLEDNTTAPHKKRQKEYTPIQYERIVRLRKKYLRYGKTKLFEIYCKQYPNDMGISEWKIQCIIKSAGIYYNAQKQAKINKKRQKGYRKKRIAELKKKPKIGFLVCLDTVVRYCNGQKRYILTAIDKYSKIAFARMYNSHSSMSAKDFLNRVYYLLDGKIENIQTDNGSEFLKHFETACEQLSLEHYFSRVKTPKDNAVNERFNRTLQEEFIQLGNMTTDTREFNRRLTEWLVEYNFKRPHQTLGYSTPIEFVQKHGKVSERYSSSTRG